MVYLLCLFDIVESYPDYMTTVLCIKLSNWAMHSRKLKLLVVKCLLSFSCS